jgi:hypothetical protein
MGLRRLLGVIASALLVLSAAAGQTSSETRTPPPQQNEEPQKQPAEPRQAEQNRRIELNLLGKTDANSGESRRNENIQFNLVDNNALKELNVRLGTTATIIQEFRTSNSYFGAEFGNTPSPVVAGTSGLRRGFHGSVYASHLNSVTSARSFFQVGRVKPAHDNDYGFALAVPLGARTRLMIEAGQNKVRGSVNGNALVPKEDERTALATDPEVRAMVERFLAAYPEQLPNRTDINPRALNTNAPQVIDGGNARARLDREFGSRDTLALDYAQITQSVDAFQFVAGQNPDTDTRAHKARILWTRQWDATTVSELAISFDRIRSNLRPEPNAVGQMISTSGLETLGPQGSIPIDRAHNLFRYAGQMKRTTGHHSWYAGAGFVRRQFNGIESDTHRGFYSFANDFGRSGITNLRLGVPSMYIVSVGDVFRGFRSWDMQFFLGDVWKTTDRLSLNYGVRFQPSLQPDEVNGKNSIPYDCDCNNLAPQFGLAYRLPGRWGIARAGYGLQYGEIFPVTYGQVRFSPPGSEKLVAMAPNLIDPLTSPGADGKPPKTLGNLYLLDPELAVPYSHQYNLSWEPDWSATWRLQLGYVGSRSHKLFIMWYENRGQPVPGIPQTTATINDRRPNPDYAEIRWVLNGSRGYYDAARASLIMRPWHGFTSDVSYWFGKAMDLGSSYTNTAADADTRISRSQYEYETHRDMKGLSNFDQTHAFLWHWTYQVPAVGKIARDWNVSAIVLAKSGTPFTVVTGSDAPGYGNVDGNGNDRPNLVDLSLLGRTVGDPDTSRLLLPRTAFSFIEPTGQGGNIGRNVFRKGSIHNVNAMISRAFPLNSEMRLTIRAESVNLFNTPQFAEPGVELASQNFGQITNTLNDGRTFRFHLTLAW